MALACGISLAVAGLAAGQLRSPMLFALLLSVRAILAAFMWASARPLLVDSVVPEARARVLARWRLGWLLGAALGAAGAGIATEGPRVGVSIAITAVSVIAVLISLMSLSAKEPGPGGVEAQRLRVLFGDDVADDLIAPTAGAAALGRVARTEAARTTLTGYVAVGFASIGVLAPALRLLVERGTDVTFGIAALSICAALLVAVIPLFVAGRGVERLRRQSPDLGAAPAFTGIMLAVLGCVGLWLAPAAVIPAALCVCVTGAIVAAVALDADRKSVV